jgi:hypothetical protein
MENAMSVETKFEKRGARVLVLDTDPRKWMRGSFTVDVRKDRRGEYFEVVTREPGITVDVLDVQPKDRHLLLMVSEPGAKKHDPLVRHKFLCGHDERHWFAAAVPGPVKNVMDAKVALQPPIVQMETVKKVGKPTKRVKRKNAAYRRQGEWFFVPTPNIHPDKLFLLKNERLVRTGGGKPHIAEHAYRIGGTTVYTKGDQTITAKAYDALKSDQRAGWRFMILDPVVYVKGKISHPDHATIILHDWHRVFANTESNALGRGNLRFLD